MIKFSEIFNVCFMDIPDFFDSHLLPIEATEEDSPLGSTPQPL